MTDRLDRARATLDAFVHRGIALFGVPGWPRTLAGAFAALVLLAGAVALAGVAASG